MRSALLQTRSVWRRTRYASTVATALALGGGLWMLSTGHVPHGILLLLAAAVLLRTSVLGRRARRQVAPLHWAPRSQGRH